MELLEFEFEHGWLAASRCRTVGTITDMFCECHIYRYGVRCHLAAKRINVILSMAVNSQINKIGRSRRLRARRINPTIPIKLILFCLDDKNHTVSQASFITSSRICRGDVKLDTLFGAAQTKLCSDALHTAHTSCTVPRRTAREQPQNKQKQ